MPAKLNDLEQTLRKIKNEYEKSIKEGRYTEFIRSQRHILPLHEYVNRELARHGIPSQWIQNERVIYGYPKTKTQDIVILPPQNRTVAGPIMSINVRSQLSSIDKNYDTLFERLFAEALNLHNRFPYMVLGYLYLLPIKGYSDRIAKKEHRVLIDEEYNLSKYIDSFLSVVGREDTQSWAWKYEAICLLLVDFEQAQPQVIQDMSYLVQTRRVSSEFAQTRDLTELRVDSFFDKLHRMLLRRFPFLFTQ